jgi:hypothetical protein
MNVLRHYYVAEEVELIFETHGFEGVLEDGGGVSGGEVGFAAVTTEGDEVEIPGLLAAFEAGRHEGPR